MNYLELVQRLHRVGPQRRRAGFVTGANERAARLFDWVADAWRNLQIEREWRWMRNTLDVALTAGQQTYTGTGLGASRFRRWRMDDDTYNPWLYVDGAINSLWPLQFVQLDEFRSVYVYRTWGDATPIAWTFDESMSLVTQAGAGLQAAHRILEVAHRACGRRRRARHARGIPPDPGVAGLAGRGHVRRGARGCSGREAKCTGAPHPAAARPGRVRTSDGMPNTRVQPDGTAIAGGMDIVGSPIYAKPGRARIAYNYEWSTGGGLERIAGIEPFDGRPYAIGCGVRVLGVQRDHCRDQPGRHGGRRNVRRQRQGGVPERRLHRTHSRDRIV